jgi:hypothetical protein
MRRTYSNPDPHGFRGAKPDIKPKMSKRQTKEEDQEKHKVYEKEDRQHKFKILTRELEMGMKLNKFRKVKNKQFVHDDLFLS